VLERYNSFFGLKVEFGAEENLVVFDRAQMMAPLASGNTCVRAAMEKLIAQYLTEMGTGEFRTMVRGQILSQLQAGAVSEEAVARGLSMSTSTLARRLRSEGLNFRELLQETQKSLALQYLQDARLSISEIGFRLGFEDLSSLSRSFRRWTGVSPREWRRQNSGGPVTALAA
jgi:AraC-like DNA-binding protein